MSLFILQERCQRAGKTGGAGFDEASRLLRNKEDDSLDDPALRRILHLIDEYSNLDASFVSVVSRGILCSSRTHGVLTVVLLVDWTHFILDVEMYWRINAAG
jgi:hypothetical protein